MFDYSAYKSVPIGSLVDRPVEEEKKYLDFLLDEIPPSLIELVRSAKTGAYIRGLCRAHNLSADIAPQISFAVLQIVFGERMLAQFAALLSSQLQLPNDKAQKMAQEIEHDLFAPVAGELSQFLATKKREAEKQDNKATGNPRAAGATNVLDLKQDQPPAPPSEVRPAGRPPRPQPPKPLPPRLPTPPIRRPENRI